MSARTTWLDRLARIGQGLLVSGASLYLLVYAVIALARLSYPFELEWMEGGCVAHVQRVLDGQPLYVAPSLNFIPFIYSPLYFYVSAIFAQVAGNGFFPLRLVSFLSSLGCFAFISMIVYRRTSSLYSAFLASCLFAATFRISGSWFDIARVDSLFLLFLLAGIYTFDSPRAITRNLVSPALLFLSFFTKQTALMVAVALSLSALFTGRRSERFWFPLGFSLLVAVSFLVMNALTAGWYRYYVFDLPAQHDIESSMWVAFWTQDIARHLAIALCVSVIAFLKIGAVRNARAGTTIPDIFILGSLFLASYFSRLHFGGYDNVLMPVYAGIAIYFGIGLALSLKGTGASDKIRTVVIWAAVLQFAILLYSPRQQIPSPIDRQHGEKLEQLISVFNGPVYLSDHPWYLGNLKRPSPAQDMAVRDVLRGSGSGQWIKALQQEMATAVAERKYEAFIVDFVDFKLRVPDFDAHYKLVDANLSGSAFHPVTGWDRRPTYLYVRRTGQTNPGPDAVKPSG